MSQEKVDKKKHDKTHRKALVRKKKLENFFSIAFVLLIAVVVVGWISFSIYSKVSSAREANKPVEYHVVDTSAITDYINSLSE